MNFNSKAFTFFVCLLIAAFFWLLSALSKVYTAQVVFPVKYAHPPAGKIIANRLPDSIKVDIRASGFTLLELRWKKKPVLQIDISDSKSGAHNTGRLSIQSIAEKIALQMGQDVHITRALPDSFVFNYNKKASKLVPVKLNTELSFAGQNQLSDSLQALPAQVEVSGEQHLIDAITFVETKKLVLKNISANMEVESELLKPSATGVDISPRTVKVKVPVSEFTEGTLELPLEAIHLPQGYYIKTFPDKVTVKFRVSLSNYDKINPSMFRAVIDCDKAGEGAASRLKVELTEFPEGLKGLSVSPEKVEFILRK